MSAPQGTVPVPEHATRRILVTGGAGFIGSALVRHLIASTPHEVLTLDMLTYAGSLSSLEPAMTSPRHRFVQLDICDAPGVAAAIADFRPGVIAHLAAESHVDRSIDGPSAFVRTNLVGTFTLLQAATDYWRSLDRAARSSFRFHHVSTDEVFGSLGESGHFNEATRYDPRSPYSASKAGADHLVRAWWHTYRLPVLLTNCSNNYGPYHFPEKLIPLLIIRALLQESLPIYGTGANVRDWLYVEDHVSALVAVLERGRPGESYLVGGRAERTNLDVVHHICAVLDRLAPRPAGGSYAAQIVHVDDRPGHDQRYAIDPSKLENELGWRARESFASGIEKTVRWYLDNPQWWRAIRADGSLGERLGRASGSPDP